MKKESFYKSIYENLKKQIESGDYEAGDFLPPEPKLEELFDVSRTTIRKAIELLARDGFVSIKQGKGTEVLDYRTTQKLNRVTSFSETMTQKGYNVYPINTHIDYVIPPSSISKELMSDFEKEIVRIQRVILANEERVAIITNYLRPELVPGIENKAQQIVSLYNFLENEYNIKMDSATEYIKSIAADFMDAEVLKVKVGTPLLYTKRITYSNNNPIEVALTKVVGKKYEYCVQLRGR